MIKPPSLPMPFPLPDTVRDRVRGMLSNGIVLAVVYGHIIAYFLWLWLTVVKSSVGF